MKHSTPNRPEPARSAVPYGPDPMPSTATPAPAEMGTIADTRARFGIPRSTQYRLAAAGHIRMLKLGRTTLVDFATVRAFLAGAPTAALRCPDSPKEATPRG